MPQASAKLRAVIESWYGDISDVGPYRTLMSKGWIEDRGMFKPPSPSYYGPREDYILLMFLRDEWDYSWETQPLLENL